jgi:hypothetical protein
MISWPRMLIGTFFACVLLQVAMAQDPVTDF